MKDDLISRQAAIDELHMHLMYRMGTESNKQRLDAWINNLPSAQPEIIRCKDCKYLDIQGTYGECGKGILGVVNRGDFCSRAERREE